MSVGGVAISKARPPDTENLTDIADSLSSRGAWAHAGYLPGERIFGLSTLPVTSALLGTLRDDPQLRVTPGRLKVAVEAFDACRVHSGRSPHGARPAAFAGSAQAVVRHPRVPDHDRRVQVIRRFYAVLQTWVHRTEPRRERTPASTNRFANVV